MSMIIPNEVLHASRLTEDELKVEIAVMLFQKEKLSLGQACQFANMRRLEFQHLLASRNICVHYDVADFEEDLKTLRMLAQPGATGMAASPEV